MIPLTVKFFANYPSAAAASLPQLLSQLLDDQKKTWPMVKANCAALEYAQLREARCSTFSVWLQFNPKRLRSTGAKVDPQSIRERRCFLCIENLPKEQIGVLYENEFLILCNPYPIFEAHFTISHIQHRPQIIDPYFEIMLRLARDMSRHYTVFYNGAQCGASAPDHFHFQAVSAGKIPIEHEAVKTSRRECIQVIDGVSVILLKDMGRAVLVFEGTRLESLAKVLRQQLAKIQSVLHTNEEPKINIICCHDATQWRVILFPRRQHRPEAFFQAGENKVTISPASVDMGGLIVTPIEKDFKTVDAKMIERIYREVSWDEAMTRKMLLNAD